MQRYARLYYIDGIRAFAILMMLQGHFIDGLLSLKYRNLDDVVYKMWLYLRGITAPVFFTVSGLIFTYLLLKENTDLRNERILKGIKRGLQLLALGYLLRTAIPLLIFTGELTENFYLIDVLHCIGIAIIAIVLIFVLSRRKANRFFIALCCLSLLIFVTCHYYETLPFSMMPQRIANFFTVKYGSVFTVIPWIAYAFLGAAISVLLYKYQHKKGFYTYAIVSFTAIALALLFLYPALIGWLASISDSETIEGLYRYRYLFTRFGDVLVVLSVFMLFRNAMATNSVFVRIGQNTLSIYVIHYIILYGGFGLFSGLYNAFYHKLNVYAICFGVPIFVFLCVYLSFAYNNSIKKVRAKKKPRNA